MKKEEGKNKIAKVIVLLASVNIIGITYAEDCILDFNNNSAADGTGGAFSSGNDLRLACGRDAQATGINTTAVGYAAIASGSNSASFGRDAKAIGNSSTALGRSAQANSSQSIAIGTSAEASGVQAIALGEEAVASASGAIAIGADVIANKANTMTVGVPIEVVRNDGTAKITVEESGGALPRTLFEISNPGNTKFTVTNSDANEQWSFANPGTGFRLSRQGSGSVEFEVKNNGNAELAGTLTENSDINAKQDIQALNQQVVLEKVMELDITEWRYKDDPKSKHIGPMAQDFYKAFELGHTDKGISTLDSSGVALAAIQALKSENEILKTQNDVLKADIKVIKLKLLEVDEVKTLLLQLLNSNQHSSALISAN